MRRSLSATTALVASLSLLAANPALAQTAQTNAEAAQAGSDQTAGAGSATDANDPCAAFRANGGDAAMTGSTAADAQLSTSDSNAATTAGTDAAPAAGTVPPECVDQLANEQAATGELKTPEAQADAANENTGVAATGTADAPAAGNAANAENVAPSVDQPASAAESNAAAAKVMPSDATVNSGEASVSAQGETAPAGTGATADQGAATADSSTTSSDTMGGAASASGAQTSADTQTAAPAPSTANEAGNGTATSNSATSTDSTATGAAGTDTTATGSAGGTMSATGADATATGGAMATGDASTGGAAATGDTTAQTADAPMPEPDAAAVEEANAPAAAAAAAATEGSAPSGDVQVTREEVTDANSRSSSEEFATGVNANVTAQPAATDAQPQAQAQSGNEKSGGLSDVEKGLLVGLGGLAVGALLANGSRVLSNSGDRVVVERGDTLRVLKDDNALLRQPGTEVETETFSDGSTRQTVFREDGSRIVTIRDADLRVIQRIRVTPQGDQLVLFDDTTQVQPVDVSQLPTVTRQNFAATSAAQADAEELRRILDTRAEVDRTFSLRQVRDINQVRVLAPAIDLDNITFETASAAITPAQAESLNTLGRVLERLVAENPREVFLVEGHTDAVGGEGYNLALSDRRAESVALALTEYFAIPPENLVVQGYGEQYLKVPTETSERANRRATVRRITPLLKTAAAN